MLFQTAPTEFLISNRQLSGEVIQLNSNLITGVVLTFGMFDLIAAHLLLYRWRHTHKFPSSYSVYSEYQKLFSLCMCVCVTCHAVTGPGRCVPCVTRQTRVSAVMPCFPAGWGTTGKTDSACSRHQHPDHHLVKRAQQNPVRLNPFSPTLSLSFSFILLLFSHYPSVPHGFSTWWEWKQSTETMREEKKNCTGQRTHTGWTFFEACQLLALL